MQMLMEGLRLFFEQIPLLIGYVTRGASFPKPLREEQERDCLKRMAGGDESARDCLIEHNLRLVAHVARKYIRSGQDMDDLISIGTIGLIKAVNTYDGQKGKPLVSYAARCIENEILMHLRRVSRLRAEVSFDEPLNMDWDGNELLLSDILGTDGDMVGQSIEDEAEKACLLEAVQSLAQREKRIMQLRFGLDGENERTQKEVADMMGISQSYISRLEKRVILRLKSQLSRMA